MLLLDQELSASTNAMVCVFVCLFFVRLFCLFVFYAKETLPISKLHTCMHYSRN